jgi:putative transposase
MTDSSIARITGICFQRRKINVSQVFAREKVGVTQVDEHIWLVTFMHYDSRYFDDQNLRARTDR